MITFEKLGKLGRVGNMLFQIAGTIGVATKNGYEYAFPPFQNIEHKETFGSDEDIDLQKYFVRPLPLIPDGTTFQHLDVEWGYHDLKLRDENISLYGYMQSEKYFAHCPELIRSYFELKVPDNVPVVIPDNAICMHIRRGDYVKLQDYHPVMAASYYWRGLSTFSQNGIPNEAIFIFTDDPEWAKQEFNLPNMTVVTGNHYMMDLYLMSQCTHFIIANSSFSWWAAWLSNKPGKQVIAPQNWFGPAAQVSAEDIYCKEWIVI